MAKKSFLLVSLKESKAKKLAEVISNKTCRRILDYLAEKKDVTESEISKELKIPISTVHYNMKALVGAKLVKSDEYHYSVKGKEVSHYKLANQYVIIAPAGEKHAIREKLKSIIPTALIMGAAAGIIKMFSGVYGSAGTQVMSARVMEKAAYGAAPMMADEAVAEMAPVVGTGQQVVSQAPEIALWFFIGAVVGVGVYLLIDYIIKRLRERD